MTYVFEPTKDDLVKVLEYYEGENTTPTDPYMLLRSSSPDLTVNVYTSGKVTLQGKNAYEEYLMWSVWLGFKPVAMEQSGPAKESLRTIVDSIEVVGSDEVGTGDYFGPVVVCAVYLSKEAYDKLKELPIRDSKKISDDTIVGLAKQIQEAADYEVLVLSNPKYNELVSQGFNMNKIKAYLHNHAIRRLVINHHLSPRKSYVDAFCTKDQYFSYLDPSQAYSQVTLLEKAEDQVLSVACASILARERFLSEMDALSSSLGIVLPKGAGIVVDLIGKRIALEKGTDIFNTIAKVHFKNTDKIKDLLR